MGIVYFTLGLVLGGTLAVLFITAMKVGKNGR